MESSQPSNRNALDTEDQRIQLFTEEAEDSKDLKASIVTQSATPLNRKNSLTGSKEDKNSSCKCVIF